MLMTVDTLGSDFDTVLYIFTDTGMNLSDLTEVTANDDEDTLGGILTSRATFDSVTGTTYHIAVHGSNGAVGTVNISIDSPPPSTGPFLTWIANYPTLMGADALSTADPDKDGIINLHELPFGLNPTINSALGGSDPNALNQPQLMRDGNKLQILYTLVPANLTMGGLLPITVGGAESVDIFQANNVPVAPINISGNDYRVETIIETPGSPMKQLRILITDPNP